MPLDLDDGSFFVLFALIIVLGGLGSLVIPLMMLIDKRKIRRM
jgi:hypothetical protein